MAEIFDLSSVKGEHANRIKLDGCKTSTICTILATIRGHTHGNHYDKGVFDVSTFATQIRNAPSDFATMSNVQANVFPSPSANKGGYQGNGHNFCPRNSKK